MFKSYLYFGCRSLKLSHTVKTSVFNIISRNIGVYRILQSSDIQNELLTAENSSKLSEIFSKYFTISKRSSDAIITNNEHYLMNNLNNIKKISEYCSSYNLDPKFVKNNMWIFEIGPGEIVQKLDLLSKFHLTDINHGIPFLRLPLKSLNRFRIRINKEAYKLPYSNRLYYLSTEMKIEPYVIANHISKRMFMYIIPFNDLKDTLEILISMGVSPKNILKDLWVFRYKPSIVKTRLEQFQEIGKQKLMPWMVKCPQDVLERSINLTMVTKSLLGENKSVKMYLAEKLNCSMETVNIMAFKTPYIHIVRVAKVKDTLDFLFSEGYTENDIISVSRVLAHSINTMKKRLQLLDSIGMKPKNLYVLCKSKKEFEKYLHVVSKLNKETIYANGKTET